MSKINIILLFCSISLAMNAQSKIVFSRNIGGINSGGTSNLMIYNPVTKDTKLMIKGTVRGRGEGNFSSSPNSFKILFNTYRYSGWKLAIADFKNEKITNVQRFTNRSNYEYNAKWSPDGTKIVYQEYNWGTSKTELFTTNGSGRNVKKVNISNVDGHSPDWTKNGKHIVFESEAGRGGNYDIYITSSDGNGVKNLTGHSAQDFAPSVSKAEDKIAFLSDRGDGYVNLYVMDLSGGGLKKLSTQFETGKFRVKIPKNIIHWAYKTCWSPNGKQIVFNAIVNGSDSEIFIINSDGSNLTQITDNKDSDITPYWMNENNLKLKK